MLTFVDSARANFCDFWDVSLNVGPTFDRTRTYGALRILFTDEKLARDFSCDYMGRDFLDASDYVYPNHGPNIHHWNSIEHFKVDGTVIGVGSQKLSERFGIKPTEQVNYFNDSHYPAYRIVGGVEQCFNSTVIHVSDRNPNLRCFAGFAFAVVPISPRFFGMAASPMVSFNHWQDTNKWSWNLYNQDKIKQKFTLNQFAVYEFSYGCYQRREANLDYVTTVELSASPTAVDTMAKVLLASLKVAIQRNLKKVSLSRWFNNPRVIDNVGIRKPYIHRPNTSIFLTKSRKYFNWSALAAESYQDLGMADVNGIAYLKDMFEFGSAATSFAKTLKSIPSKKVKSVAAAWLSVHYGFKLFYADTKELLSVLEKETARRSSLSRCAAFTNEVDGDITFSYGYQVYYDQWAKVRSMLEQTVTLFDLGMNLDNIWDMVPYSFVIDWFVDVGSVLKSLQNYAQLTQEHSLICAGRSIKASTKLRQSQLGLDADDFTVSGVVSYYTRQYRDRLVLPSLIPSVTFNPFDHLIEAAALTIVRVAP